MNRPPKLLRSVLLAVCDLADSRGISTNQITNYVKSRNKKIKLPITTRVLSSEIQKALKYGTKHYLLATRQGMFRMSSRVIKPVKECTECRRRKRQKANAKKRRGRRKRKTTRDNEKESSASSDDSTEIDMPVQETKNRQKQLRSRRRIGRKQSSSSKSKKSSDISVFEKKEAKEIENRTRKRSKTKSKSRSRSRSLLNQGLENIDFDQKTKESIAEETDQPNVNLPNFRNVQPSTNCGNAECFLCPTPENIVKDDDAKII